MSILKKLQLLTLCLAASLPLKADPVTKEQAQQKAAAFMVSKNLRTTGLRHAPSNGGESEQQPYYVFNAENGKGFVIVSGDDQAPDILAYSDKGNLDMGELPPDVAWWLQGYEEQLASLHQQPQASAPRKVQRAAVNPLVMTEWGQGQPYNIFCPVVNAENTLTGCVATAMAQVMYYHHAPKSQISGIDQYPIFDNYYNIIGWRDALPAITFDWANMKPRYSSGYNESEMIAVAQLMQYCGWSVMTDYGLDVSTSSIENIALRLKDKFGYSSDVRMAERKDYSDTEWETLIYNELSARRPVVYSGNDAYGNGGHAFVCDGYDGDGLFHINWGWEGNANGFYRLSVLHPSGYNYQFSKEQGAVIGIHSSDMAPGAVIKADNMKREYGEENPELTYTVGTMTIPEGKAQLSTTATKNSSVNNYTITASRGTLTVSDLRLLDGVLTIEKAPLVVTAKNYTLNQGDPMPGFEAEITGFKLGETSTVLTQQPKFNCSAASNSAPGTYTITPYGASASNYTFSYVPGTLTIVKVPAYELSMVGDPQVEAGATSTMTFKVKNTGDLDYDKGFYVYFETFGHGIIGEYDEQKRMGRIMVNQTIPAGSETTVQFSFEGAPVGVECAYFFRYFDKDGTENRLGKNEYYFMREDLSVVVKADDKQRQYGDANPTLTYTVTSNHKPEGVPELSTTATKTSPVGGYPITIARGTITEEDLTLTNGTLTVTKAPLTVTARSYTIMQGDPLPDFEADITGFKNGEDKSVLTVLPTITTAATSESQPGTYDIIASGADAQNYTMSYVAGTLTIETAEADLAVQANVNNADEWTESEIYGWVAQVTGNEVQLQAELTNNAKLAYDDDAIVRIYRIQSGTYGLLDKEHREHLRIEPGATGTMTFTFTGEMGAVYFFNIYYLSKGEEKEFGSWWFTLNAENGIATLVAASPSAEVRVLSIDGKLLCVVNAAELQHTLKSLPKGIYIVNGQKVKN